MHSYRHRRQYASDDAITAVVEMAMDRALARCGLSRAQVDEPMVDSSSWLLGPVLLYRPHRDRHSSAVVPCRVGGGRNWPLALARRIDAWITTDAAMIMRRRSFDAAGDGRSAPLSSYSVHPVVGAILAAMKQTGAKLERSISICRSDFEGSTRRFGMLRDVGLSRKDGIVGVLYATILGADGEPAMKISTVGGIVRAYMPGRWPTTLAVALVGRTAGEVGDLFRRDPRADQVPIVAADICEWEGQTCLSVEFADVLVPIVAGVGGGEPWRPTRAVNPWIGPRRRLDREFRQRLIEVANDPKFLVNDPARRAVEYLEARRLARCSLRVPHGSWIPAAGNGPAFPTRLKSIQGLGVCVPTPVGCS